MFHALKQVFVVNNIAELFVLTIKTIGATDHLKEAMILHGFVNIQIGAGRRIKASEQLIHHN